MNSPPNSSATGQLAQGPLTLIGGVPIARYVVLISEKVHEFESLHDVALFSATHRVQLTRLTEEEGYPEEWCDPSDAAWNMLEQMLKYMNARR